MVSLGRSSCASTTAPRKMCPHNGLSTVIKAGLSIVEGAVMTLWVIKRGRVTDRATMRYGRAGTIEKVGGFLLST